MVLPASLAGLIDADAETLGLHRRLGEVSSARALCMLLHLNLILCCAANT